MNISSVNTAKPPTVAYAAMNGCSHGVDRASALIVNSSWVLILMDASSTLREAQFPAGEADPGR